jgi:hypothetical protein
MNMRHITTIMQSSSQKRAIMRRVWYSYFVGLVLSRYTLRGLVLGVSGALFVLSVSVPHIVLNLLSVQVKAVPQYVWDTIVAAVQNGEFLKLVTLGVIVFSLLSFRVPKRRALWLQQQEARTV